MAVAPLGSALGRSWVGCLFTKALDPLSTSLPQCCGRSTIRVPTAMYNTASTRRRADDQGPRARARCKHRAVPRDKRHDRPEQSCEKCCESRDAGQGFTQGHWAGLVVA
jgi:hypothetical protein